MSKNRKNGTTNKDQTVEDLLKALADTGFSLLTLAKERIESTVNDLVDKGKVSSEDGRSVVNDFLSEAEEAKANIEDKARQIREKLFGNKKRKSFDWNFELPHTQEIKKLSKRVKKLEKAVAKLEKKKKKNTTRIIDVE